MNARADVSGKAEAVEPPQVAATPPAPKPVPVTQLPAPARRRRRPGRFALMAALPLVLVAAGGYYWTTGGRFQETENASLRQARVSIAAEAAGRVVEVDVAENRPVRKGEVLFVIDPEPYRIALSQADAALAAARLNVEQLRAAYSQAQAQVEIAQRNRSYLEDDLKRQTALAEKGISARQSLEAAERDFANAEQQLAAARQGVEAARAALGGDPEIATDRHPSVLAARAQRDKAAYDLGQTTVRAPDDGVVSQAASFRPGQFVTVGTPLFSLVETSNLWVEANFKETQLTNMQRGQKAEIVLDTFPDRSLEATVDSIGAGTGAEFSLLPAQNATGNWVKVTQRIPVRLKLDAPEADLPLRTGMSATVSVDTGRARGWGALAPIVSWLGVTPAAASAN